MGTAGPPEHHASAVDVSLGGPGAAIATREGVATAPPPAPPVSRRATVAVSAVLAVGIVLRFATRSHLWLDEVLAVNIARLPLGRVPEALRRDGSPPLYYLLLHGWIRLFGDSDWAVRALSGVCSVAALPLVWHAGRRLGGRRVGWAAALVLAASPFAVRYATEARMYSLVVLLVLVGGLALFTVLERRSRGAAVVLALTTAALMLSHYWSFYLLAVLGGALLWRARRGDAGARRALLAMASGGVLFLPWLPSFAYQAVHTGTPWAAGARVRSLFDAVVDYAGGSQDLGQLLALSLYALAALALFGRPIDSHRVELDLRTRGPGRALALVSCGTVALGILVGHFTGGAFSPRYASVAFPVFILLAALGTDVLVDDRLRTAALALVVVLGIVGAVPDVFVERTHAARVAAVLAAQGRPGDVVAYCPDQLGPSVSRLLPPGFVQLTFPAGRSPELVDWADYRAHNHAGRPDRFARMVLDRTAPGRRVWLVWAPGYRTLGSKCTDLVTLLGALRPGMVRAVKVSLAYFEHPGLVRYPPA